MDTSLNEGNVANIPQFQAFHMIGFVLVLIIAVVSYGIFMHTLLFPDMSVSWEIIFKLLFRPYLLVFGELGINSYACK